MTTLASIIKKDCQGIKNAITVKCSFSRSDTDA